MPNRKIKHIVAKLVGASTEETLDVYDVDAVHTADIANNLTTTNEGYVLDARQGKALNDSLTNMFVQINGSYPTTNVSANSGANISPTTYAIPTGYAPIGIKYVSTGHLRIGVRGFNIQNGQVFVVNDTSSTLQAEVSTQVYCVKTSFIS